jgi:hypothetical protein
MADERDKGMEYPWVDLLAPMMFLNALAFRYLILLNWPWLIMQAWMSMLDSETAQNRHNPS